MTLIFRCKPFATLLGKWKWLLDSVNKLTINYRLICTHARNTHTTHTHTHRHTHTHARTPQTHAHIHTRTHTHVHARSHARHKQTPQTQTQTDRRTDKEINRYSLHSPVWSTFVYADVSDKITQRVSCSFVSRSRFPKEWRSPRIQLCPRAAS